MTTTHLTILTGASRGMGAALAEQLLTPGAVLLCLSRGRHDTLEAMAGPAGARCEQWQVDLADPLPVATRVGEWLARINGHDYAQARLINNAGVISRVGPIDDTDLADLSRALRVGLESAMLLTAVFLHGTRGWPGTRKVLNISSGLGRRAMAGSSSYCAAKAGMDHFSRASALDEMQRPGGARIVSLAPGVIDTDMQTQLRSADAAVFPEQDTFVQLKQRGQLSSAADAARRVLTYLERPDFGKDAVADVRDA